MQTELVGFGGMPRQIKATRPVPLGADAILPTVAGHEVATGITDGRRTKLTDQLDDVLAETVLIRLRMTRLVDAVIHATAQMLDERTEQTIINLSNLKIVVND